MWRAWLAVVLVLALLGSSAVVVKTPPRFGLVIAFCLLVILGGIRFCRTRRTWTAKAIIYAIGIFLFAGLALAIGMPPARAMISGHTLRARCANSLKQIGLALLSYHDAYKCFPPACVCDKSGTPMHSWRVLILPYIERFDCPAGYMESGELYKEYSFKEPWNGPNNQLLEPKLVPWVYTCTLALWASPYTDRPPTSYVVVTGEETAFPGCKPRGLGEITRAPRDTVLVVEVADSDIHWMEPRDVSFDDLATGQAGGCGPLTSHHVESTYWVDAEPSSGNIVCADGRVHFLRGPISPEDARVLLTVNDGQDFDVEKFAKRMPLVGRLRWDHIIGLPAFCLSFIALLVLAVTTPRRERQATPDGSSPTVEAPP